jgi:hypothetical protein
MTQSRRGRRRPWLIVMAFTATVAAVAMGTSRAPVSDAAAVEGRANAAVGQSTAASTTPPQQSAVRAAPRAEPGCERCHGELELLRQQTGSLARAQRMLVRDEVVAHSAHADLTCAECHSGYARFPHSAPTAVTQTCASCHAAADSLWTSGEHASADEPVTCTQCHDSHDIVRIDTTRATTHAAVTNARCMSCHENARLAAHEPHLDGVSCARCHAPHDVRTIDHPAAWLAPARQAQTCGSCHDTAAVAWRTDIHGDEYLRRQHLAGRDPASETVTCTSCHTGHEMLPIDDPRFASTSVERCAACHEKAARTFFGSYHGKATALGSRVAASCADCHGAHDILPDSAAASRVARANLVETCGACHAYARPAFVQYDSHPDPFDRTRNPWIFYSFWLMNGLLVFVLVVFGGHTLLWWLRLWLDKRRGIGHGHGQHQEGET